MEGPRYTVAVGVLAAVSSTCNQQTLNDRLWYVCDILICISHTRFVDMRGVEMLTCLLALLSR